MRAVAHREGEMTGGTPVPQSSSVHLVVHDTLGESLATEGQRYVTLPHTGGTVVVDLVVENSETIGGFFGSVVVNVKPSLQWVVSLSRSWSSLSF